MKVVVAGGGVVGASAAYHLAKADVDVLWVDRNDSGQATAAGAGIVFPWQFPDSPPGWLALGPTVADHYTELIAALRAEGIDELGYAVVGGITLMPHQPAAAALAGTLRDFARRPGNSGIGEVEVLPPGEPATLVPVLRQDMAGVTTSGMRRVDGRMLRNALHTAAVGHGVRTASGTVALAGRASGTRVTVDGVITPADRVIVAGGAWSTELCAPLGVDLPVSPQRGQILHFGLAGRQTDRWPIVRTGEEIYLLGFPGGRVVVGATREPESGFDFRVTAGGVHHLLTAALELAPGLTEATLLETRVGFRPASRDGLPVLGRLDTAADVIVATGMGPHGLTFGPYAGVIAAELAMDRDPPVDLNPYRPTR